MKSRRFFRREWAFPLLVIGFISVSAHATRDELSAQAASDMRCDSVSIIRTASNEYLATGCGRDRTYTCDAEDVCTAADEGVSHAAHGASDPDESSEAADVVVNALTDMACACATAGLASHGAHGSRSASTHHTKH